MISYNYQDAKENCWTWTTTMSPENLNCGNWIKYGNGNSSTLMVFMGCLRIKTPFEGGIHLNAIISSSFWHFFDWIFSHKKGGSNLSWNMFFIILFLSQLSGVWSLMLLLH